MKPTIVLVDGSFAAPRGIHERAKAELAPGVTGS